MGNDRLRYLTAQEKAALNEFVRRLRQTYGDDILLVRLFGSKVRGDSDTESDLDVLVVVRGNDRWPYWGNIVDMTSDLLLSHGVVISPLIVDDAQYMQLRHLRAPIYRNVEAEGVDLWTRTPGFSYEFA